MNEELFMKYITRQCSAQEWQEVEQWLQENPDNARKLFEAERVMELKDEIYYDSPLRKEKAWKRVESLMNIRTGGRKRYGFYWKWGVVASIIVLLILNLFGRLITKGTEVRHIAWSTVYVPMGQQACVVLSDGTRIRLNSGSTLRYPESFFEADLRQVELQGEAFFEVQADTNKPFNVSTEFLKVSVLGTVFNLKAYHNERLEVGLLSGKVKVNSNDLANSMVMKPNDFLTYLPDAGMGLSSNQNLSYISAWTKKEIAYANQTLQEICRDLERRFDVRIHIVSPKLARQLFTCHAGGKNITVKTVLDLLKATQQLNYEEENGIFYIVES